MAELIPLEYRVAVARQSLIRRWIIVGALTAAASIGGFTYTFMWKRQQARAYTEMQSHYDNTTKLLQAAKQLQTARDQLAAKMARIESLQHDTILLQLLGNVSNGFSDEDCLRFIRIDAHIPSAKSDDQKFQVQMRGITVNDTTHSKLLDRLTDIGRKSSPKFKVPLGEHHLTPLVNGEVTAFDLTCEPLPTSTASAKSN